MNEKRDTSWNLLETVKLLVAAATPICLFWLVNDVNDSIREAERERVRQENQHAAVQELSTFIYERYSRSALLLSALRRHSREPVPESMEEVVERKRAYDEAYFRWNSHLQSNLFLVREVLDSSRHTIFEEFVEDRLVKRIFTPIDVCLTNAYDLTIRGRNPTLLLTECKASVLIQRALNCGYGITDDLYRHGANASISVPSDRTLNIWCRI